jgi:hypothetical protein
MPYNPGLTCQWQLKAPVGYVVVVNFFNVSVGSSDCLNFHLVNDTTQQLNVSLCEKVNPKAPDVSSRILLTFATNSGDWNFHFGFDLTYEFINVTGEK